MSYRHFGTKEDTSAPGNTGPSHGKTEWMAVLVQLHEFGLHNSVISTHRISVHPSYIRLFSNHQQDIKLCKLLHCRNNKLPYIVKLVP